jgi:hypothetical protein
VKGLLMVTTIAVLCALFAMPGRLYAQERDAAALVEAWRDGINATPRSMEKMTALFHDDATFTLVDFPPGQSRTYKGTQQMTQLFFGILADNSHAEGLDSPQVTGETVTWRERWSIGSLKKMGIETVDFTLVADVLGGKFETLTMTLSPESVAKLTGGQASQPVEAGMPTTGAEDLPLYGWWALAFAALGLVSGLGLKMFARKLSGKQE